MSKLTIRNIRYGSKDGRTDQRTDQRPDGTTLLIIEKFRFYQE